MRINKLSVAQYLTISSILMVLSLMVFDKAGKIFYASGKCIGTITAYSSHHGLFNRSGEGEMFQTGSQYSINSYSQNWKFSVLDSSIGLKIEEALIERYPVVLTYRQTLMPGFSKDTSFEVINIYRLPDEDKNQE